MFGYYTVSEICKLLKVKNRKTLYDWEKKGKIPKFKRHPMNNYRVYTEQDIVKLKRIMTV